MWALVDVAFNRGRAIRRLVILGMLPFAGEGDRTDRDRRAVSVELSPPFLGRQDSSGVESVLECLLEFQHRAVVWDSDLDGEAGLGAVDDPCGHSRRPPGREEKRREEKNRESPGFYLSRPEKCYINRRSHPVDPLRRQAMSMMSLMPGLPTRLASGGRLGGGFGCTGGSAEGGEEEFEELRPS